MSSSTALSRSSNSPRYFAPATIAPRSSATSFLPRRLSGTSPATMRWASPSTTAVLPTPGSPMRTGLFLVRRESTCTTRRISASRPMTGSSLPSRASAVRSDPYLPSASKVPSGFSVSTVRPPRSWGMAASMAAASRPNWPVRASASSRWSVETNESPMTAMSERAFSSTAMAARESPGALTDEPATDGSAARACSAVRAAAAIDEPAACSRAGVVVSGCSVRALSRWAGSVFGCPPAAAARTAAESASWALVVSLRSMYAGCSSSFRGSVKSTGPKLSLFHSSHGSTLIRQESHVVTPNRTVRDAPSVLPGYT